VNTLTRSGPAVSWYCLDGAAIGDVDYSAALVLGTVLENLRGGGVRVVFSNIIDPVHAQLDRYGLAATIGADCFYETAGEALDAYRSARPPGTR
jgi:hypothetical protein